MANLTGGLALHCLCQKRIFARRVYTVYTVAGVYTVYTVYTRIYSYTPPLTPPDLEKIFIAEIDSPSLFMEVTPLPPDLEKFLLQKSILHHFLWG